MAIERNNTFHLLLSDDELKLLNLLAERDGLDAPDYLRMVIRMMPSTNSPSIAQVTRIGAGWWWRDLCSSARVAVVSRLRPDSPASGKASGGVL